MSEIERLDRRLGARLGRDMGDSDLIVAPADVASRAIASRRGARPGDLLPLLDATGPAVLLGAGFAREPVTGD